MGLERPTKGEVSQSLPQQLGLSSDFRLPVVGYFEFVGHLAKAR